LRGKQHAVGQLVAVSLSIPQNVHPASRRIRRLGRAWERKGGTTFHFVKDGIESALARAAAGSKDTRISGGAGLIRQYLNAGLVDEFQIHYAPVILSDGLRLVEGVDKGRVSVRIAETVVSPHCTHVRYEMQGE
jgi:dihydrofolate reductase